MCCSEVGQVGAWECEGLIRLGWGIMDFQQVQKTTSTGTNETKNNKVGWACVCLKREMYQARGRHRGYHSE